MSSLANSHGRRFDSIGIDHTRGTDFDTSLLCTASKDRMAALQLVIDSEGAGILTIAVKSYIDRARPGEVTQLIQVSVFSYPSSHSLAAASLYLTCLHLQKTGHKIAILTMTVAIIVLVGVSRIYLGVHYPGDVASGISLGTAWALLLGGAFRFSFSPRSPAARNNPLE